MPGYNPKALQAIAHDPDARVAYWRVVKANGGLINRFPGGAEGQAERLRKEGFALDRKGKTPKVTNFRESLVPL
jgi:alkylated DNA nucleotide flippase Atl1